MVGVIAPRMLSSATGERPLIERVAGDDSHAINEGAQNGPSITRPADHVRTPLLAAPPPLLIPATHAGATVTAQRNEATAKGGQTLSARDIADKALGFTAFIRRGPLYGAGVLLDSAGHVLTCLHVIEGDDRVTVSFHDGAALTAEVIETDKRLDLALLHVDAQRTTSASVAPIASIQTGDEVFGMGAPHKLRFSMSHGLVSYVGRPFDELYYLQTDLPTNAGNSGGPVMNERGEVIGITTFIYRDSQGLAFALPIDYAFDRFKHRLGSTALDGARFSAWQETARANAKSGG